MTATALWFVGLIGLVVAAVVAAGRARAMPGEVAGRGVIGTALVAYTAVVGAAVWTWGGAAAEDGRARRLADGAAVRIAIEGVRVPLGRPLAIGHGDAADVQIPGDGPATLVRIERAADGAVIVHAGAGAQIDGAGDGETPDAGTGAQVDGPGDGDPRGPAGAAGIDDARAAQVRAGTAARDDGDDDRAATPAAGAAADRNHHGDNDRARASAPAGGDRGDGTDARSGRAGARPSAATTLILPAGGAIVVRERARPARGVILRRDARDGALVIASAEPTARTVRAGDAVRIGGARDAIPGLVTWDVVAPRGASAMLAVPRDPTACGAWSATPGAAHDRGASCEVTAGAFTVRATPIVPDAALVVARGARVALLIGLPGWLVLAALVIAPRRRRRFDAVAAALVLAALAAGLAALACWRLLWAYRIDALAPDAAHATRVASNTLGAVALGAAFAGVAVIVARLGRTPARRALGAVAAWAGWGLAGVWLAGLTPPLDRTTVGVAALSLLVVALPWARRAASGARMPRPTLRTLATIAWRPEVVLGAIAAAGLAARVVAPRAALPKLALAYATVIAGHAAVRALLRPASVARRCALVVTLGAAVASLGALDTGVTLAIVGVGLAIAALVAGHDALYDARQATRVGVLEREHARLLVVHGIAAAAVAVAVAAIALAAGDRALVEHGAFAVLHVPLVAAGLFVIAALVARSHRRSWAPWLAAAGIAVAVWSARGALLARATAGDGVGARRVAAVVEPGYALLRDDRAFVANASAWREVALAPAAADVDRWRGEGFYGAAIRDPGVRRSVDNDYLPVLVARDAGLGGLIAGVMLLLAIVVGAAAIASARLRHASADHRARWLWAAVTGALVIYQPLAALGVLPLTGISWPGLGIDSPADLWLFALGAAWCVLGDAARDDERVRRAPRLIRARRVVLGALVIAGVAGVIVVARAGACALARVPADDARVAAAMRYAGTLACDASAGQGATLAAAIPARVGGVPGDAATARFDRELGAWWQVQRAILIDALAAAGRDAKTARAGACPARAGAWRLARDGDTCRATLDAGWPRIELAIAPRGEAITARCAVALPDDVVSNLRVATSAPRPRIRVVSAPIGIAADDAGELAIGDRIVRLRAGAPARELAGLAPGLYAAARVTLAPGVTLELRPQPRAVVLRGDAELFVAEGTGWRRAAYRGERALDRLALIAAGPAERRRVVLFRPPRAWPGDRAATVDVLLADASGDAARRIYPHGDVLPELGWVNPYDVRRSLGLDGWIHAAEAHPGTTAACGTLAPPPIARDRVCSESPLDGVTECRVTVQPELAHALRALAGSLRDDAPRDRRPVRIAYVVLRGDTGELLAQANQVTGRAPLAFPPVDADAEARLIALRDQPGEADAERVDWNLPIAIGSTFKPVVARAAELAFPRELASLTLTAAGHAPGCRARRGRSIDPLMGHCPPTTLGGALTTADLHEFLARSPNWFQAALGLLGLGLPDGRFEVDGQRVTLDAIAGSDLASWPAELPLTVADARGPILGRRGLSVEGARRTPMWARIEALLGRPLCTLGSRAACERAGQRADVCAARGLPIATPTPDLRNLVALGPDRIDLYSDDEPRAQVPVREYLQLLRGSGVHPIGSLAQITDAFGRVVYDPRPGAPALAASWFPAPVTGIVPDWSCARSTGRANTVRGADGGLCAVVQPGGTAHAALAPLLDDPAIVIYGAKTGTIDSLADIARNRRACRRWNAHHAAGAQLACGKTPPDDSLIVVAFGVVTPRGTVPITLGLQLQRGGTGSASRAAPAFLRAIAAYLRGA